MGLNRHPPAGATAILPTVDKQVYDLGWYCEWTHLYSAASISPGSSPPVQIDCGYIMTEVIIIFAWAMIMNNIGARR